MVDKLIVGKTYIRRKKDNSLFNIEGFFDNLGFTINRPNKLLYYSDSGGVSFEHQKLNNRCLEGYKFWYLISPQVRYICEEVDEYSPFLQEEMEL